MEKEENQFQYSLFRVPAIELSTPNKKKVVAGLIDASGSMGSYWAAMAKFWNQSIAESAQFLITFSHAAKLEENTILSENLNKHGGGMTNIYAAFQMLEQRLQKVPQQASITILFISDGQDTTNGQEKLRQKMKSLRGGMGRDITMLCLGIQSGFPTKMSMDIRQLYHTGDQKLPALFLIQYASQKAFFNKFESMANCFNVANSVKALNGQGCIMEYPWQTPKKQGLFELKQNQWLMVNKNLSKIDLIYNDKQQYFYDITSLQTMILDDLVDCFRGWVQKVQLLSMDIAKMKQTQKIAELTCELMKKYTRGFEKYHKLYIISERPLGLKESFKQRASSLIVKNVGSRIKWFIDQLQIIAKGVGIGGLGQYEAAKRIGIGTITGKYHQKALALKGITVKDFQIIKQDFTTVFQNTKLSEKPSNQDTSIFTLQNQKEVFQQPDFLDGLKLCGNQYDFVQSFPVVGYSLKVKRYDGSMINPWKVRVLQLAKTHKSIDSVYLANNSNKYELSVGQGKVQQINAVLPLFGEQDVEMAALFNTKLFKLAVSFMVVQNIDTFHEQAYLALLASTFAFLIKQPQSQWRDDLIGLIYTSIKVTYWQTEQFKNFILKSLQQPHLLFNSKQKEDHTDITKVMLMVFFIGREKLLSRQKLNHFVDLVMVHYVEKTYVQNQFKLSRVAEIAFKVTEEPLLKDIPKEVIHKEFNIVKGYDELKKIVEKQSSQLVDSSKIQIVFNQRIFMHSEEDRRITYEHIRAFYQKSMMDKFDSKLFIYYFGHALKGKDPEIYNTPISRDIQDVKKEVLKKIDINALGPNQGKQMKQLKKMIEDRYVHLFQRTHFGITPFTQLKLIKECQERGIDASKLHFNAVSGMIGNACLSPNCKYYLQPMKHDQFSDHMRLWRRSLPSRFHWSVVSHLKNKLSVQKIYDMLIAEKRISEAKNHKTKEQVLDYIRKIESELAK